jgi:uncharacterized protein YwqG
MDKAKVADLLRNAGLGDYVEAILPYAKPCIRLHAHPTDNPNLLPLGSSRVDGLPDMPPNMKWPTRNGRPCEFIAQINLSEASQYDEMGLLPKDGLMLFFYDGLEYEDAVYKPYQMGSETISYYTGDITLLERVTNFPDLLKEWQRYRACTITFETDWMLPNGSTATSIVLERALFGRTGIYDPPTPLAEAYRQLTRSLEPYEDRDKHHLFGYPEPVIQDDPLYRVPGTWDGRKLNEKVLAEWMLLLQISSDDGPGMLWGDTSSLYYCIRKDDLITGRFENALCIMDNC